MLHKKKKRKSTVWLIDLTLESRYGGKLVHIKAGGGVVNALARLVLIYIAYILV